MARKNTLGNVVLGVVAASTAGIITLGSIGEQPQNTNITANTIAKGSVAEHFSIKAEAEQEAQLSYEIIEVTEPVTISFETSAPPETTVETTTTAETTTIERTTTIPITTTTAPPTYKTEQTVYWVKSGEVYHVTSNCSTLKRSKTIYKGTVSESNKPRVCKVCGRY